MESVQKLYQESSKLGYDIDARINEIYVGFKQKSDMDDAVYVIQEKINVFSRQVDELKSHFDQLPSQCNYNTTLTCVNNNLMLYYR